MVPLPTKHNDATYLDTVGGTPLVRVIRILPDAAKHARVLLKLETQNPGGSHKDRVATHAIEEAERRGLLHPGGTVVEYSTGNTGIGVAITCAAKGYKCIIIMPQIPACVERFMTLRQLGADIHVLAPTTDFDSFMQYAVDLVEANPGYYLINQFFNEANPEIHYQTTGREIWDQSGGDVDYFISAVGTGGMAAGAGGYLVEKNPRCEIIAVEPTESRAHVGGEHHPHTILGIGAGRPTHFLSRLDSDAPVHEGPRGFVSEFAHCHSEEAIEWAKRIARTEGILVGPSSGATIKVAMEIASRPEAAGKTIVAICASHAIRYSAHPLWEDVKEEALEALPNSPNLDPDASTLQWMSPKPRTLEEGCNNLNSSKCDLGTGRASLRLVLATSPPFEGS